MTTPSYVNQFKRMLKEPKASIGLWLALADSYSAEISAGAGFDFLVLDGEHSPLDLRTMLAELQSIAPFPTHPVLRRAIGDTVAIKQMLDIGAQNLLIPMVETGEQAAQMVAATRYPPKGVRGVGAAIARAAKWGPAHDYLEYADEEICLILQVETVTGLENVEAIARTEGVDGIFIGAADLSASMGYLGQSDHPEVEKAMADAFAKILAAGKAPGMLATTPETADKFIALGARFAAVGVDAHLLSMSARQLLHRFRPDADDPSKRKAGY